MRRAFGIDFGTTNSAIACASADGSTRLARFTLAGEARDVCRSILFFDAPDQGARPRAYAGPAAIDRYLASGGKGRLMQSLKSFLSSRHLHSTAVFGKSYTIVELVAFILRELRRQAEEQLGTIEGPVVVGRPVRFAWSEGPEDDALAQNRLSEALAMAGIPDVVFELEPLGAACEYEAGLDHDELVLVADIGGGTSDFCLMRLGPGARAAGAGRIVATSGVGKGGDTFDAAIVHELVTPELGRGSEYRSHLGKILPTPAWLYLLLSRWHQLSVLRTPENRELLQGLERQALEPRKLRRLIELVENDKGYALYASVEKAKMAISRQAEAAFVDDWLGLDVPLVRASFEEWVKDDLAAMARAVDEVMTRGGATDQSVDRVFLTGGSGLVPAVRAIVSDRFGAEKVSTGDFLVSVASGLSRRALDA